MPQRTDKQESKTALARPLVSAVIPAHNSAGYLRDALDSVLGQDYQPLEVVVVDEGSTDRTMINVCLGSGLFKRSVFESVGLIDETLSCYEDHDWFLQAREQEVSMVILRLVTLVNRRRADSMSHAKRKSATTMIQVPEKSLARRRNQHGGRLLPC